MKKLSIFLLFLVSISSKCLAVDYVAFNSPHDGDSYTITSGTTMNITIDFSYYTDKQSYLFKLTTEQGTVTISNGHTVNNVTAGAKHWSIELQMYDGQYWTTTSDAVDFSVVYGPRNITADNNFTASDGTHGSLVIDGVTRTIPLTGYPFTKTIGQNTTLLAISPQTDNESYQRIWNTASCEKSDWKRNESHKSYDQTYSFVVAPDDDGKIYKAYFAQVRATTSGNMSSSETWFTSVTLVGNVTVPAGVILTLGP